MVQVVCSAEVLHLPPLCSGEASVGRLRQVFPSLPCALLSDTKPSIFKPHHIAPSWPVRRHSYAPFIIPLLRRHPRSSVLLQITVTRSNGQSWHKPLRGLRSPPTLKSYHNHRGLSTHYLQQSMMAMLVSRSGNSPSNRPSSQRITSAP